MRILVINGPNLNMLGSRDVNLYGNKGLEWIHACLKKEFQNMSFEFRQSNDEQVICGLIQSASENYDGIILNPGAFTHTSIAIRDAIEILKIPIIEVHLSNITNREEFRKIQVTTSKVTGYISGLKENSYLAAAFILNKILNENSI